MKISMLLLLALLPLSQLKAQVVFFDGLGRAVVTNNSLKGNITEGDTTSVQNSIGGYSLFDLGVNIMPSKTFHGRAVLRARNEFGQFFGGGSSISFREMQLEGIFAKGIYYQLGDIDLMQTKYTLFNFNEIYNEYESDIFRHRRDIVEYENFNHGNKWRMQGAQTVFGLLPNRGVDRIDIMAYATRIKPSDELGTPDRFMIGGQLGTQKDSNLFANVNYAAVMDNAAMADLYNYSNHVVTGDLKYRLRSGASDIYVGGESGMSSYDFTDLTTDSVTSFSDHFYDVYLQGVKKDKFSVQLGYKDVGPQFSSPGAQTPRINPNASLPLFGTVQSGAVARGQLLYDRLSQESFYNPTISTVLFTMQPRFNNAMPYGEATPNRRGVYLKTEMKDSAQTWKANLNLASLGEIIGEGTEDLRNFLVIYGGTKCSLDKKLDWENELTLSLGGKIESTSRSGVAAMNFSSVLVDFGLSAEVAKNFYTNVGLKYMSLSGDEFIGTRDGFNGLDNFSLAEYDDSEMLLALALNYKFSDFSLFTLQYSTAMSTDNANDNLSYNLNQLFINYSINF